MGTVVYNLYAPNLICIGIDGGNNGEYTGRIWHQYSDEPLSFQGTMEMVRSIENLFNQWNFPQSSTAVSYTHLRENKWKRGCWSCRMWKRLMILWW